MSGFLTINDQAALAVDWNIKMLLIYLPYSFYLSITTLVGTSLGEGNIPQTKRVAKLNLYISIVFSAVILFACQGYVHEIVGLYTDEPKISSVAVKGMIAYVVVSFPFEYLVNLLMGLISGVGVQDTATVPTIICYCLVSIPSSYIFTFTYNQGISGLFYGCALGDFVLCIIYARLIANIDLEVQLKVIQEEFADNAKADFVTNQDEK